MKYKTVSERAAMDAPERKEYNAAVEQDTRDAIKVAMTHYDPWYVLKLIKEELSTMAEESARYRAENLERADIVEEAAQELKDLI